MEPLLLLTHRMPYPPNKGDKIRSFHLLRHLAQRYRVHLGSFVDAPEDHAHLPALDAWCASRCVLPLSPARARLASLRGLLRGRALSLDYYRSPTLSRWVRATLEREQIRKVVVFSSAMAQFVPDTHLGRALIDFVDVDSEKWRQYSAQKRTLPLGWLYAREGRLLLQEERRLAQLAHASLFVSASEAALFRQRAPESAERIRFYGNGVDAVYFDPAHHFVSPYPEHAQVLVFTGVMDYWPNVDAVCWFAQHCWPQIRARHPDALFYVVGTRPNDAVRALAGVAGIVVTGSVPDVRPYLAHAQMALAPLRIARGVQNKVLEAMAMGKTVLATAAALEGIDAHQETEVLCADTDYFAQAALTALAQPCPARAQAARARVLRDYDWSAHLGQLDRMLSEV